MGTRATAESQAGGVMLGKTRSEERGQERLLSRRTGIFSFLVFPLFALFVCFAGTSFAQNLETLAEQIRSENIEQKRNALFQIRNLESEAASRLAVPALRDAESIVRATAAYSVIYLPKAEAAQALVPLLQDTSELARREAAYALGKVGDASAVIPLLQIIGSDKFPEVRGAAAVALGEIGDISAVEALTGILQRKPKKEEEFLRRAAARSIGQIAQSLQNRKIALHTPESFLPEKIKKIEKPAQLSLTDKFPVFQTANRVLMQALQNPREFQDARRESAFALGAIGDAGAISVLRSQLDSRDYYLAEIAAEALTRIAAKNLE